MMPASFLTFDPLLPAASFAAVLQAERDEFAALVGLLQTEQEILVRDDSPALATLADEKSQRLARLNRFAEQRARQLGTPHPARAASAMLVWLSHHPEQSADTGRVWRELLALAETARRINLDNGALIESAQRRNQQKLAVLRSAAGSGCVYRADGHLQSPFGRRNFSLA